MAGARMCLDCLQKVGRSSVVEEENTLTETPQWRCTELIRSGMALGDVVRQPRAHLMDQQIGEEVDLFVTERSARRQPCHEGRCVTERAAGRRKQCSAVRDGGRISSGRRWREEAHEDRELHDIARHVIGQRHAEVRVIFRNSIEEAPGRFVPLILKYFVGHPLLDVVRLARKELQRLVLRFPPNSRDRTVIAIGIRFAVNTQGALLIAVGNPVRENRGVLNRLDQTRPEKRRGDSEDEIVVGGFGVEVWLATA